MTRFWDTVAFRLALGYGLLAIGSMSVIAAAFYFGTVGVLARSTDAKLVSVSQRLADHYETRGGGTAAGGAAAARGRHRAGYRGLSPRRTRRATSRRKHLWLVDGDRTARKPYRSGGD